MEHCDDFLFFLAGGLGVLNGDAGVFEPIFVAGRF